MTSTEKTVYFGSFFELTSSGRDELIARYQSLFEVPEDAPFIGFDPKRKLFYCKTNDSESVGDFIAQFKAFLDFHMRGTVDLIGSPRILPIPNTWRPDEFTEQQANDFGLGNGRLIEYEEESDSNSEKSSGPISATYWRPKCGNTSILPNDTAAAIANLTGCFISPEPDEKRVKLLSGRALVALAKLQRLEPLLELQYQHRSKTCSNANAHILVPTAVGPGTGVTFVPCYTDSHADRVIVESPLQNSLTNMVIAEQRNWDNMEGKYKKPANLSPTGVEETRTSHRSKIWNNFQHYTIGDPKNKLPALPSNSNSKERAQKSAVHAKFSAVESKYLHVDERAKVMDWSKNVDLEGDPSIPSLKPAEAMQDRDQDQEQTTSSRHRRVVEVDSDADTDTEVNRMHAVNTTARELNLNVEEGYNHMSNNVLSQDVITASHQPSTNAVDRSAFYAGVPQDEEFVSGADSQVKHQLHSSNTDKVGTRKTKRILAYDGACDEFLDSDQTISHRAKAAKFDQNERDESKEDCDGRPPQSDIFRSKRPTLFDPSKYGLTQAHNRQANHQNQQQNRRGSKRPNTVKSQLKKGRQHQSQPINTHFHGSGNSSTPVHCKLPNDSNPGRSKLSTAAHECHQVRSPDLLIDLEESSQPAVPILPPPGFDIRRPAATSLMDANNIMDAPIEQIHLPDMRSVASSDNASIFNSVSASSNSKTEFYDWTPQLEIPKVNISYLRSQTISKLRVNQPTQQNEKPVTQKITRKPKECLAKDNDIDSRKFHSTMSHKAPNPRKGKGNKKNQTQEIKEERNTRISKAKADAYGSTPASEVGALQYQAASLAEPEQMSAAKRRIMKSNPNMAAIHQDVLISEERKQQASLLLHGLQDLFEAARSFVGVVSFEIQLGQILVVRHHKIKDDTVYERHQWDRIFREAQDPPEIAFSNIVTANDSDIDRMLELRATKSDTKYWRSTQSKPIEVFCEFLCQDKEGLEFSVIVDSCGKHEIRKSAATIGKVALHFPGQVWDACAVVKGASNHFNIPEATAEAVDRFVSGLYIKINEKSTIFYRLPSNNTLTVLDVTVRRTSLHECSLVDRNGIQLKLSEVKKLTVQAHDKDRKLHRAFERSYMQMVSEGHVHYEASILDTSVNAGFKFNNNLELGEVTPAEATGKKRLCKAQLHLLLDSVATVVQNMDWVGMSNYGTLQRVTDDANRKYQTWASTLPPPALSAAPGHDALRIPLDYSIAHTATGLPSGFLSNYGRIAGGISQQPPVHGLRAGTQAEIYQDSDGYRYRLGQGGARIPLAVREDANTIRSGDIVPGDSASQAGRPRAARGGQGVHNKPPGFW